MQIQFLTLTSGNEASGHSSACSRLHLCNGELRGMRRFFNIRNKDIRDIFIFKGIRHKMDSDLIKTT